MMVRNTLLGNNEIHIVAMMKVGIKIPDLSNLKCWLIIWILPFIIYNTKL